MWVSPSGILGWREAKAEEAKKKARKIEEKKDTAIGTWKSVKTEEGLVLLWKKQS